MENPTHELPTAIDHAQATAWFARQRLHPLSEDAQVEFETWLKADPAHTQAWSQCERLWTRVEGVRDDPRMLAIREEALRRAGERLSGTRRWRIAGTAIASLLAGVAV